MHIKEKWQIFNTEYSETSIKRTPKGPSRVSALTEGARLMEVCKNYAVFVRDYHSTVTLLRLHSMKCFTLGKTFR